MAFTPLAPQQTTGWLREIDRGSPYDDSPDGTIRVKVVVSPKGLAIIGISDDADAAQQALELAALCPAQIKKILCG